MDKRTRITTKIGDVFCIVVDNEYKVYFQYICNDTTQLNSSVICVFSKRYSLDAIPKINDVVNGSIMFYAHTVLRWGIHLGCWEKIGKAEVMVNVDIIFRQVNHMKYITCKLVHGELVHEWCVWKVNEPMIEVKNTDIVLLNSERGSVVPAIDIINRVKTGKYAYFEHRFQ